MRLTTDAASWALRFYRDHFLLVFGLSLIAGLQRFVSVRFGEDLPLLSGFSGEMVTMAVRLLLVALILRIAFGAVAPPRWKRVTAGIDRDQKSFYLQFVVLAVAFAIFDLLPNAAMSAWVPESRQDLATAIVLLVKNPTVIAFTLLWMTGIGVVLAQRGSADRLQRVGGQ